MNWFTLALAASADRKRPQPSCGRGKLAERIEVEFGPFRPAASRRAECFLVALPPVLGSSAPKINELPDRAAVAEVFSVKFNPFQALLDQSTGARTCALKAQK